MYRHTLFDQKEILNLVNAQTITLNYVLISVTKLGTVYVTYHSTHFTYLTLYQTNTVTKSIVYG